jgi:predicted transcriptional regulator
MSIVGQSSGYKLFLDRSRQTPGAVQREILQLLADGPLNFRELKHLSQYWQSQIACALARQMRYGRVRRNGETYERLQ